METLATVVFERTAEGVVATKTTGDEVPRRLRTLLLAIDGRSPVGQYVPFLTAFAPLSEKFAELEQMGYLRRVGDTKFKAAERLQTAVQNSPLGKPVPGLRSGAPEADLSIIHERDLLALAGTPAAKPEGSSLNAFERELQILANQMSGAPIAPLLQPVSMPSLGAPRELPQVSGKPVLADLLNEMDAFLLQSAGADALPISLMLEHIKTLAQLRAELSQYFELVQRYGPSSEVHIKRLTGMLDKAGN